MSDVLGYFWREVEGSINGENIIKASLPEPSFSTWVIDRKLGEGHNDILTFLVGFEYMFLIKEKDSLHV